VSSGRCHAERVFRDWGCRPFTRQQKTHSDATPSCRTSRQGRLPQVLMSARLPMAVPQFTSHPRSVRVGERACTSRARPRSPDPTRLDPETFPPSNGERSENRWRLGTAPFDASTRDAPVRSRPRRWTFRAPRDEGATGASWVLSGGISDSFCSSLAPAKLPGCFVRAQQSSRTLAIPGRCPPEC
jgi:hypothetical protein